MPILSRVVSKGVLPLIAVVLVYTLAICCAFIGLYVNNPISNPASGSDETFYDNDPTVREIELCWSLTANTIFQLQILSSLLMFVTLAMFLCVVLLLVQTVKFGPQERLAGFKRMFVFSVLLVIGSALRMGVVFYSFYGYYETPDWVVFIFGYCLSDLIIFLGIFVFIGMIWYNSRRVITKRKLSIFSNDEDEDTHLVSEADGMSSEILRELNTPQIYRV